MSFLYYVFGLLVGKAASLLELLHPVVLFSLDLKLVGSIVAAMVLIIPPFPDRYDTFLPVNSLWLIDLSGAKAVSPSDVLRFVGATVSWFIFIPTPNTLDITLWFLSLVPFHLLSLTAAWLHKHS
jgi:hypothetical protein